MFSNDWNKDGDKRHCMYYTNRRVLGCRLNRNLYLTNLIKVMKTDCNKYNNSKCFRIAKQPKQIQY